MNKEIRAARAKCQSLPGGSNRRAAFPTDLRGQMVSQDGRSFYEVDGYATVFNRGYQMWDEFGPFTEIADQHMLDRSLAGNPDVAFLLNHSGMTMARTRNRTLTLTKDDHGLHTNALLNPDRTDVSDLMSAISDGLVNEMSFGFMLEDGEWNEDFSEFRITRASIDRGDVSAVNYGANPYTNIGARSQTLMRELRHITPDMAREVITLLSERGDIVPVETREAKPVTPTLVDKYAARWAD